MNLLVTNTRATQAYAIIRALRPHAEKIVVTMYGKNRLSARLSHAANSRLVDKRYDVPSPVEDWRAGNIQKENTEREEAYIQAILKICVEEKIDTIFPSWDPKVYVFSKNKARFEKLGVLVVVPEYETVLAPLDKYRTIRAAEEVGFPCPRTYLPEGEEDLRRIVAEVGFPLVIKPRFTSGRGMEIVQEFAELSKKTERVRERQGMPLIQEYNPGQEKQQFYLVLTKDGESKAAFCPKTHRLSFRLYRNSSALSESSVLHAYAPHATKLAQRLGWWGGITVQTKIDPRDGLPKLMEVNPRLGHHLWYRTELGINAPLMCVRIARGEEVEGQGAYPVGKIFVSPVEDALTLGFALIDLLIYKVRTGVFGRRPIDPQHPPLSVTEIIRSYRWAYLGGKAKVFDPYFKHFFQDPLVSVLWWAKYCAQMLMAAKHLGR